MFEYSCRIGLIPDPQYKGSHPSTETPTQFYNIRSYISVRKFLCLTCVTIGDNKLVWGDVMFEYSCCIGLIPDPQYKGSHPSTETTTSQTS